MYTKKRLVLPFLLPGLIGILLFYVVPFFGGIWYSMTDGSFENAFVGFQNYSNVWQNPMFQLGLKNTMELSLICAPGLFLLSFALSVLLNRIRPAGTFFRSSVLLPYLMPSSAVLIIWLLWFDFGGPVNRLVTLFGGSRVLWLQGMELRYPVILLFLWKNLGFCVVIFLAALQAIPDALYEYATLEGASFTRQAFSITLPLIVPSAFLVFILCWVNAFRIFREVYLIGGAYPVMEVYTLQHFMNNTFKSLDYQKLSAAAIIMAIVMTIIIGILFLFENKVGKDVEG